LRRSPDKIDNAAQDVASVAAALRVAANALRGMRKKLQDAAAGAAACARNATLRRNTEGSKARELVAAEDAERAALTALLKEAASIRCRLEELAQPRPFAGMQATYTLPLPDMVRTRQENVGVGQELRATLKAREEEAAQVEARLRYLNREASVAREWHVAFQKERETAQRDAAAAAVRLQACEWRVSTLRTAREKFAADFLGNDGAAGDAVADAEELASLLELLAVDGDAHDRSRSTAQQ